MSDIAPVITVVVAYAIAARSAVSLFSSSVKTDSNTHDVFLPIPEPLGRGLKKPSSRVVSKRPPVSVSSTYSFGVSIPATKLSADEIRSRLIDADAAKRRAMTRVAQLEKETESLVRRCEELERKAKSSSSSSSSWFGQKFISSLLTFQAAPGQRV